MHEIANFGQGSRSRKNRGLFPQNRMFFFHTPFFKNDIFPPKYSENFPFSTRFPTASPLYLRYFLIIHHIFSPANQYFIFFFKYTPLQKKILSCLIASFFLLSTSFLAKKIIFYISSLNPHICWRSLEIKKINKRKNR